MGAGYSPIQFRVDLIMWKLRLHNASASTEENDPYGIFKLQSLIHILLLVIYLLTYLFHVNYVPSLLIGNVERDQQCVNAKR